MRIFMNSWFKRYAKRQNITNEMMQKAIENAEDGLIYAKYGGNVIKQRIARTGQGKSSGYRSVIIFKQGDKSFFVYGFAKKDRKNINQGEEAEFKELAKQLLALSDEEIDLRIKEGKLVEVES